MESRNLVIVSNRLPIVIGHDPHGNWNVTPGSGGLVTAFSPVLRNRGGIWIGWLGGAGNNGLSEHELETLLAKGAADSGYSLKPVDLSQEEIDLYYFGFSNEIIWPLFHDLPSRCNFAPDYWPVYQSVNCKFAKAISETTTEKDFVWVQDYHLMLVAQELKKQNHERKVGFFLHIPFPSLDIFLKLPWRFLILQALMEYDVLGFQTMRDRRNFIQCVRTLLPGARISGSGTVADASFQDRSLRIGAFPIGIDYQQFSKLAETKEASDEAWIIHANLPKRKLILGVDRLDYSKGIPRRLRAFENALERYPELRRNVTFIQVVVPSRTEVEEYRALKQQIERYVGEINGRFTETGWTPILYIFRPLNRTELVAYYRTCEIALITPLKDGMNLVAKEYCASNLEEDGVLILSEFAGAAAQLQHGALMVNPFDVEGVADAIHHAYHMPTEERQARMSRMRRSIQQHNIFRWVNNFLKVAIAKDLNDFPPAEYYLPSDTEQVSNS